MPRVDEVIDDPKPWSRIIRPSLILLNHCSASDWAEDRFVSRRDPLSARHVMHSSSLPLHYASSASANPGPPATHWTTWPPASLLAHAANSARPSNSITETWLPGPCDHKKKRRENRTNRDKQRIRKPSRTARAGQPHASHGWRLLLVRSMYYPWMLSLSRSAHFYRASHGLS